MTRFLLFWFLVIGAAQAHAQCPGSTQSWSSPLPSPMAYMTYDLTNNVSGLPAGLMTVLFVSPTTTTAFVGVSQSVATQFPISSNPASFYATRVLNVYHELLLYAGTNCPVLGPSGYAIWTR
jgi:hypothetical protein